MDKEHNCGCHDEGCDCNHDHNHEEELETMTLTLDDDTELQCYVLGVFDCDDKEYIALLPVGDEDVFLYRYEEVDDDVKLDTIEDDDEYDRVSEVFMELFNDEDDFEEDEEEDEE